LVLLLLLLLPSLYFLLQLRRDRLEAKVLPLALYFILR
jgi:hypothetical protein